MYNVQCKAYNNTIHPRSIYIVSAHTHIVDMQLLYLLVYIPAHIYCGYENILAYNARAYNLTLYVCAYPY